MFSMIVFQAVNDDAKLNSILYIFCERNFKTFCELNTFISYLNTRKIKYEITYKCRRKLKINI